MGERRPRSATAPPAAEKWQVSPPAGDAPEKEGGEPALTAKLAIETAVQPDQITNTITMIAPIAMYEKSNTLTVVLASEMRSHDNCGEVTAVPGKRVVSCVGNGLKPPRPERRRSQTGGATIASG